MRKNESLKKKEKSRRRPQGKKDRKMKEVSAFEKKEEGWVTVTEGDENGGDSCVFGSQFVYDAPSR